MSSPIIEKVLLIALGLLMLTGVGLAGYAAYEHNRVQVAQIQDLARAASRAEANAAAAASEASATRAAFSQQASSIQAAQKVQAAATSRLASAVAANPSAAAVIVPADVWDSIDGGTDAPK